MRALSGPPTVLAVGGAPRQVQRPPVAAAGPGRPWLVRRSLLVYGAARAGCLAAVGVAAAVTGHPFGGALQRFDGIWYREIARHGYPSSLPHAPSGHIAQNPTAFFPLYPWLVRALMELRLPFVVAGTAVAVLAGAGAAVLIALLTRQLAGPRVALLAVAVWSVQPAAYVLSATYGEGLFCLLAAGCLFALLRQRWWSAGVLALLAGATRSTGLALDVACLVAAVLAVRRTRRWRPLAAPLLAPLGTVGYFGYLWWRTGDPWAWFGTERHAWRIGFDGGVDFLRRSFDAVTWRSWHGLVPEPWVPLMVICAAVLFVLMVRDRMPPALLAYTAVSLVLVVGTAGAFSSAPRFLLPIFPLAVPLARRLSAARPCWPGTVLAGSGAAMLALGVATLVVWRSAYP